jgi:hypothetical protein
MKKKRKTTETTISGETSTGTTTTTASTTVVATTTSSGSTAPIYWGAWMEGTDTYSYLYGGTWGNAPWDTNTWQTFEQHAGKQPSIVHWGVGAPWDHDFTYWTGPFNLVQAAGALSLVDMNTGSVALSQIANGSYDTALRIWATEAKAWGHPFFLRLDWEMNGGWFPWGTTASNQNTPADYVAAWRHIHDIFTAAGASNVTWVWCPNLEWNESVPFAELYPGDAYVNWTCLDGYNQDSSSTSFSNLYQQSYSDLLKLAPTKPIMIGEVASKEYGAGVKADWISNMLSVLPTNFPKIKAVVWFNWRIADGSTWDDWEIESSSNAQNSFANGIASSYYAPGGGITMPPSLQPIAPLG